MNNQTKISVVIPLYNKEREIAATLRSVLKQTAPPLEIIVVNDGSTDNGESVVRSLDSALVRIVNQANSGVSIARNRGMEEAKGEYVAFLDADDVWHERFLEKIADMIARYPDCAAYATAFNIMKNGKAYPSRAIESEGVVEDFFRQAMRAYICVTSAVVFRRDVFAAVGGFPEGMKLAEDQYLFIKIATAGKVCFSPKRLMSYNLSASNRSVSIYRPEKTDHSFEDLYRPEEDDSYRNEFIARCAISKAILLTAKGDTDFGRRTERMFGYTKHYRRGLWKLKALNRLPRNWRWRALLFYERCAWLIAKKGL